MSAKTYLTWLVKNTAHEVICHAGYIIANSPDEAAEKYVDGDDTAEGHSILVAEDFGAPIELVVRGGKAQRVEASR